MAIYNDKKRIFNCCVEAIEYTPISLKKILEHFEIIGYNNYSLKIKNSSQEGEKYDAYTKTKKHIGIRRYTRR